MVLIGYARISTLDQEPTLQEDALRAAGCERIFGDRASGALADRPELGRAIEYARAGDTLIVWRLDRLGRSLRNTLERRRLRQTAAFVPRESSQATMG